MSTHPCCWSQSPGQLQIVVLSVQGGDWLEEGIGLPGPTSICRCSTCHFLLPKMWKFIFLIYWWWFLTHLPQDFTLCDIYWVILSMQRKHRWLWFLSKQISDRIRIRIKISFRCFSLQNAKFWQNCRQWFWRKEIWEAVLLKGHALEEKVQTPKLRNPQDVKWNSHFIFWDKDRFYI